MRTVARALDVEGKRAVQESTEGVGTRHRSVYRLCSELKEAVAVVISRDGVAVREVEGRGRHLLRPGVSHRRKVASRL